METFLNHYHAIPRRFHLQPAQVVTVARAIYYLGIKDPWRSHFWMLLAKAMRKGPDAVVAYLRQAIMGYFLRMDIAEYAPAAHLGLFPGKGS